FFAAPGQRAISTEFHDDERNESRELLHGRFDVTSACDPTGLAGIRHENIDVAKHVAQIVSPTVFRVVVGVERGCQAGGFHALKELRNIGTQAALQIKRREVEMAGIRKIVQVEIGDGQLGNSAGVCKDLASGIVIENDSQTALAPGGATNLRNIDTAVAENLERDLAKVIASKERLESDAAAERSEIVRKDGGGRSQGEDHSVCQQFTLGRKFGRQTVENKIEIQFARNGDVKAWHARSSSRFGRPE